MKINTSIKDIKLMPRNFNYSDIFIDYDSEKPCFSVYFTPNPKDAEYFNTINKLVAMKNECKNYARRYFLWFEVKAENIEHLAEYNLSEYHLYITGNTDQLKLEDTYEPEEIPCILSEYEECLIASLCDAVVSSCAKNQPIY